MRRAALLCALVALAGCRAARTDPAVLARDGEQLAGARFTAADTTTATPTPAARWWERFEDPALDALVADVLAQNLDLRQAAARVREADARARSARGRRGLAIDGELSAARSLDRTPTGERVYANLFSPSLGVAWQADLFGRLRAAERASVADLLATESDRLALAHVLVAQAARLRVDVSTSARLLELARAVVASRASTLASVENRYARGVPGTSAVDVRLARENLAAARAALPELQRELDATQLALDVLLGRTPALRATPSTLAAPLPLGSAPPVGVPAALLDRRPDLVAARRRLEASAADVDVSLAALRPDLVLSGSLGAAATELGDVLTPEALFASIAAGLTAPLFTSGRLQADVDAARARADAAAAAYAQDVLVAVREVNGALVAERGLRAELVERLAQREEARRAEELARERYRSGLENLLVVLDSERRRASNDERVLRLQAAVWNARIDLHLALGGDWFSADDTR